jgi:hypothetical protein
MNKRIDFSKLGGYPLAQDDLDWLQQSYQGAFSALANLAGDKVIITGMVEAAGTITAGWVAINGALIPFLAGSIGTGEFDIFETPTPLTFNDGNTKDVLFEKYCTFTPGGAYQYSDLIRLGTLKNDMPRKGDIKMIHCDAGYIAANFVAGLGIKEREGWAICDGNNGTTVDMGNFFPMAYKPGVRDMNTTGGNAAVTLTSNQQGKLHARAMVDDIGGGSASVIAKIELGNIEVPRNGASNQSGWGTAIDAPLSAATDPVDLINPYKVLLFIQKIIQ